MAKTDREIFDRVAETFAIEEDDETVVLSHASFDATTGALTAVFEDGSTFSFPARSLGMLKEATDEEIGDVRIVGGDMLHFEKLDAFYEMSAIMARRVGFNQLMAHLASRAGRVSSPAKAAAARANGAKGGRPRKTGTA